MAASIAAVYEAARQYVGRTERIDLGVIAQRDCQRFAIAAGDLNPLYFDREAARVAGYPDVIAPPLFLSAVLGWEAGPPESALRADGTTDLDFACIPLPGLRLMGGGQELELHNPVLAGAIVSLERRVAGVELREGRSGPMLLLTLENRFFDGQGRLLLLCRETFIAR